MQPNPSPSSAWQAFKQHKRGMRALRLLAVLFAVYSCKLAWQSHEFHDISTSSDATPLWIPQIAMAVGTVILAIAFLDELVLEMMGKRVDASSGEALRNE